MDYEHTIFIFLLFFSFSGIICPFSSDTCKIDDCSIGFLIDLLML